MKWLKSRGHLTPKECGIQNLQAALKPILEYDQVQFKGVDGVVTHISREEIIEMAACYAPCERCQQLEIRIKSLEAQLETPVARELDLFVLVKKYIVDNYVRTYERLLPRKTLFNNVNAHLKQFGGTRLKNQTSPIWKKVVSTLLKDTSRYRKFKLKLKSDLVD